MEQEALIALGSNQPSDAGTPADTLRAALAALAAGGVINRVAQVSRFFRTPAYPAGSGPDFVNAAAILHSDATPPAILAELHRVEALFGRTRHQRWAARPLDLDLLAIGRAILPSRETWQHWADLPAEKQARLAPDEIVLPHPRLQDRAFVLVPLCDVAAGWRHPVTGRSVAEMRDALPQADLAAVEAL